MKRKTRLKTFSEMLKPVSPEASQHYCELEATEVAGIYLCICQSYGVQMQRTAKIFMNNRNQAVRLPKEFQFATTEVFIRKQGDEVILTARPKDWSAYLSSGPVASPEFMEDVEDLPVQEREL